MRVSSLEESSDEELLGAYAESGDLDALQVLLKRHESRVYGLAFRILGDANDAFDATQDVFLLTFRKAKSFRHQAAFTTWLYRLTVNACRDLGRKKSRMPVPVEEVHAETTDRSETTEDRIVVEQALRQIPDDQREALVLREIGGLGYEEIAATLKVPIGTVKSRIARARIALGDFLESSSKEPQGPDRRQTDKP